MEELYDFTSTAIGVLQVFCIIGVGFFLTWKGKITHDGRESLSNVLLLVSLPALMVITIVDSFKPDHFPGWWMLPIASLVMTAGGMILGAIFCGGMKRFRAKRELLLCCGYQNCGYLPMALVAFVCTGDVCSSILVYIFLFMVGFNASVFAVSFAVLEKSWKALLRPSAIANPLTISTVIPIVLVLLWGTRWFPQPIHEPLSLLGKTSFPLALLILGSQLAEYRGYTFDAPFASIGCMVIKLVLIPLITFAILPLFHFSDTVRFVLLLQATMPTAVMLVVVGEIVKADNRFLSGVIMYSHLIGMISIPAWLAFFQKVD